MLLFQMFLDTFKAVYGQKAVDGLLSHCRSYKERIFLQSLGLLIGMKSWTDDFKIMLDESSQVMLNHTKQAAEVKDVACIRAVSLSSHSIKTPPHVIYHYTIGKSHAFGVSGNTCK